MPNKNRITLRLRRAGTGSPALLVLREDVVDVYHLDLVLVPRPYRGDEAFHRLHLVRKDVGQILDP